MRINVRRVLTVAVVIAASLPLAVKAMAFFILPLAAGCYISLMMGVGAAIEMWPSSSPGGDAAKVGQTVLEVRITGNTSGGGSVTYDIPAKVGQVLPAPPAVPEGQGTVTAPLSWSNASVRAVVYNGVRLGVSAAESTDGVAHVVPAGEYESIEALLTAVQSVHSVYNKSAASFKPAFFVPDDCSVPLGVVVGGGDVFVCGGYVKIGCDPGCTVEGEFNGANGVNGVKVWLGGSDLDVSIAEARDGVKRMKTTATGIDIDASDPDWNTQERTDAAARGPAPVVVSDGGNSVSEVSVQNGKVVVGRSSQNGALVRTTIITIAGGSLESASDSSAPGSVAVSGAEGLGGTGTSGGSGTSSCGGAGQPACSSGGSCGAPGQPPCQMDDSGFANKDAGGKGAADAFTAYSTARGDQLTAAREPPAYGLSWFPSLMPGASTACRPLNFHFAIDRGPLAGYSSDHPADFCPQLAFVQQILGWFFFVGTAFYVVRAFFRANAGGQA